MRAKQGAGPVTLSVDLSYIGTILNHAKAIHGVSVDTESVKMARTALRSLNLIGNSMERDRRPTSDEIDELLEFFETYPCQMPMRRIIQFAIMTRPWGENHKVRTGIC